MNKEDPWVCLSCMKVADPATHKCPVLWWIVKEGESVARAIALYKGRSPQQAARIYAEANPIIFAGLEERDSVNLMILDGDLDPFESVLATWDYIEVWYELEPKVYAQRRGY